MMSVTLSLIRLFNGKTHDGSFSTLNKQITLSCVTNNVLDLITRRVLGMICAQRCVYLLIALMYTQEEDAHYSIRGNYCYKRHFQKILFPN